MAVDFFSLFLDLSVKFFHISSVGFAIKSSPKSNDVWDESRHLQIDEI